VDIEMKKSESIIRISFQNIHHLHLMNNMEQSFFLGEV